MTAGTASKNALSFFSHNCQHEPPRQPNVRLSTCLPMGTSPGHIRLQNGIEGTLAFHSRPSAMRAAVWVPTPGLLAHAYAVQKEFLLWTLDILQQHILQECLWHRVSRDPLPLTIAGGE